MLLLSLGHSDEDIRHQSRLHIHRLIGYRICIYRVARTEWDSRAARKTAAGARVRNIKRTTAPRNRAEAGPHSAPRERSTGAGDRNPPTVETDRPWRKNLHNRRQEKV